VRLLVAAEQWFPDVRGGVARVATETSRGLARLGHEVTVVAPRTAAAPGSEVDGLTVHRVVRRDQLPKTLADPSRIARAVRELRLPDVDVLLGHTATDCAGLLQSGVDAPLVYAFHASAALEARFLAGRLPLGPRWAITRALLPAMARVERRAVDAAHRILVLSEFSRSIFVERHPEAANRAVRVHGGVDTERFSPGDRDAARRSLGVPPEATLLVATRRLVPRMGLEELVEACASLGGRRNLQLVIVGDGPLRADLERLVEARGLAARLTGRVPDDTLVDWYRAADLVVLPTVAYEGFGLVTAEALACGTPVLGTPVGATPEVLGPLDEALLADGADAAALARGIDRVLDEVPALRERCRAYAVEQLSWEHALPGWEDALAGARS
jgi:glycosyltransferase involved in cell wall biosynthesis